MSGCANKCICWSTNERERFWPRQFRRSSFPSQLKPGKALLTARYYDFNVFTQCKHVEKLKYMHRNPMKRELVNNPQDWPWSSYTHYWTGQSGTVEIESWWSSTRRELGLPSTHISKSRYGHPQTPLPLARKSKTLMG